MTLKSFKPTSAGRRFMTGLDFSIINKKKPEKLLLEKLKKTGGRNNYGVLTCRHRGGGTSKKYRIIDFNRDKDNIPAVVEAIEYDPNRNVFIALLLYKDGERRYILAPEGLKVGDELMNGENVEPKTGNCLPLKDIPLGFLIHNIELTPGRGGKLVRSAGCFARLLAKEGNYAHIQFPSGEVRMINIKCRATIGQLCNIEYNAINWGKAGRNRWRGIRPTVRGTAQNPVSHPMGGGEGRTGGGRHPCSPTAKLSKGGKTRKPDKASSKFIIKHRTRGRFQNV